MAQQSTARTRQYLHTLFYSGYGLLLLGVVGGWAQGNLTQVGLTGSGLIAVARLFGLLAGFSVLLQLFLMSRTRLIDRYFDLQETIRLHRWNGYSIVTYISLHVTTIVIGYAGLSKTGLWSQFLLLVTTYQDVFKALLAVGLITVAVTLSVGKIRHKIPYELWYYVHLTLYAAILLALLHQIHVGSDLVGTAWFRYYWLSLYVLAFGTLLYFRVLRIGLRYMRHRFYIDRIVPEAEGIYSVYVGGRNMRSFSFEPGQYAGWRVLTSSHWWQSHPYSFSSITGGDTVRFTVNVADGNFSRGVALLKPGSKLLVDGPRGSFTADRATTKRVVLIAGGIGVAPYLSTIEGLLSSGKDVSLLYGVRQASYVAFRGEFKLLQKKGLRFSEYISGNGKRIDEKILREFVKPETTYFLCGPDAMTQACIAVLVKLGVPQARIITERFST